MGGTNVTVILRNPADPVYSWGGLFLLVHTGATDSLVARSCIEEVGLEPEGSRCPKPRTADYVGLCPCSHQVLERRDGGARHHLRRASA